MNISDTERYLKDGNLDFSGGVDSDCPPSAVDQDQLAFGINCTVRRGVTKPRPGWKRRTLQFVNGCEEAFLAGFFQEGQPYNGPNFNALISSHGGRQFQIEVDGAISSVGVTASDFTIPALDAVTGPTVQVHVNSTAEISSNQSEITIGVYAFTLIAVDDATHITVQNTNSANSGQTVSSGANIRFAGAWPVREITPTQPGSTSTTVDFTIPAVGSTVDVTVASTVGMTTQMSGIAIGGNNLTLISVNSSTTITVKNLTASTGLVSQPATVNFTQFDTNNEKKKRNWARQGEIYYILQDNQSQPIIYDGSTSVRANPASKQVPVGNIMCYTMGRLAVAMPDRMSYRIGDLVGGDSGTPGNSYKDAILYFKENDRIAGGGDLVARTFGMSSNSGIISAMKEQSMGDTSLGQGPMIVSTPTLIDSVNLPFDRTTWANLANPLQTSNPILGPMGPDLVVSVNGDLWYRSSDGIRSYITAQRQFNGQWGNTPQSAEVNKFLETDTQDWLDYGSMVLFDNRLLMTVSPQMTAYGCYHRGLMVLDFNIVSKLRKSKLPAWEGIWTGLRILKIRTMLVDNETRCFMYVLNDNSEIELYEMTRDLKADFTEAGEEPVYWEPTLRGYSFGNLDQFKKLKTARAIFTNLAGTFSGSGQFRSDETSYWVDWHSWSYCQKDRDCGPWNCTVPGSYDSAPRYPVRFPEPPDDFDDISHRKKSTGYEFQLRLKLTGYAELKQVRVYAIPESENLGMERTDES